MTAPKDDQTMTQSRHRRIAIVGCIIAIGLSSYLALHVPYQARQGMNLWFGADTPRVIADMTDPLYDHNRTYIHPLFPLLMLPAARTLTFLGISSGTSAQLVISLSAGMTVLLLLAIMQSMNLQDKDRLLLTGVFLSSGAFMFWWSVPETFPIGSLTILIPFYLLSSRETRLSRWALATTGALAITITNISAAIVAAWFSNQRKHMLRIGRMAIVLALSLSLLQKSYLPKVVDFWNPYAYKTEIRFLANSPEAQDRRNDPKGKLLDFWFYPAVVPPEPIKFFDSKLVIDDPPGVIFPYSLSIFAGFRFIPSLAWTLLLGAGVLQILKRKATPLAKALIIFVGGQLLLHLAYGDQPFLYSAHFMPAMILLAAHAFEPMQHKSKLALMRWAAVLFIVLAFPLNISTFFTATKMAATFQLGIH